MRPRKDIVTPWNTREVVTDLGIAQHAEPPAGPIDLSVIFVSRNEEAHIEACIRTTIEAAEEAVRAGVLRTMEYILVDSASTDRTVEIASPFPVRIARLEPSWPLSCSAGCYVGLLHARGTYTAIINADMTIDRRFFADALPYFGPDVGAVAGVAKEDLRARTIIERLITRYSSMPLSFGTLPQDVVNHPGGFSAGTLIVRTDAVRNVGSYNPFLRAAEDMDVRQRLLRAGWRVLDVPVLQGLHFWASEVEPLDLLQYYKTILRNSVGLGQMAKYHVGRDPWLARRAAQHVLSARTLISSLPGFGWSVLIGLHLLGLATVDSVLLVGCLIADAVVAAAVLTGARRARLPARDQLFETLVSPAVFTVVRILGFARGFLMATRGPKGYPARAAAT